MPALVVAQLAHPDQLVPLESQESLDHKEGQESPAGLPSPHLPAPSPLSADSAPLDLVVSLDPRDQRERMVAQERKDPLVTLASVEMMDPLDQPDLKASLAVTVMMVSLVRRVTMAPREPLEPLDQLDLLDPPERKDPMETMVNQANVEMMEPKDHPDLLAQMDQRDLLAKMETKDHKDHLVKIFCTVLAQDAQRP